MKSARLLNLLLLPILVICTISTPKILPTAQAPAYVEPALLSAESEIVPVIVTGDSAPAVARAVRSVGGRVQSDLWLIDAVAATVPADRVRALAALPGITSVVGDKQVRAADITVPAGAWPASVDVGADQVQDALLPHVLTVRDTFGAASYDGNDGSANWSGDWQELGESDGPATGVVRASAGITMPASGMAVWSGTGTPSYSTWHGAGLSGTNDTVDMGDRWRIMVSAAAPTRSEAIVAGVEASDDLSAMIWDGSGWSALPFSPMSTASTAVRWGVAVAYEHQSGDAMLVWDNGTSGTNGLSYRVWDGTTWSDESTIPTPRSGEPVHMRLVAHPTQDSCLIPGIIAGNRDNKAQNGGWLNVGMRRIAARRPNGISPHHHGSRCVEVLRGRCCGQDISGWLGLCRGGIGRPQRMVMGWHLGDVQNDGLGTNFLPQVPIGQSCPGTLPHRHAAA